MEEEAVAQQTTPIVTDEVADIEEPEPKAKNRIRLPTNTIYPLQNGISAWSQTLKLELIQNSTEIQEAIASVQDLFLADGDHVEYVDDFNSPFDLQYDSEKPLYVYKTKVKHFYDDRLVPEYNLFIEIYKLYQNRKTIGPEKLTQEYEAIKIRYPHADISENIKEQYEKVVKHINRKVERICGVNILLSKLKEAKKVKKGAENLVESENSFETELENLLGLNNLISDENLELDNRNHSKVIFDDQLMDFEELIKNPNEFKGIFNSLADLGDLDFDKLKEKDKNQLGAFEINTSLTCFNNLISNFDRYKDDFEIVNLFLINKQAPQNSETLSSSYENITTFNEYILPPILVNLETSLQKLQQLLKSFNLKTKDLQLLGQIAKINDKIQAVSFFLEASKYFKSYSFILQDKTLQFLNQYYLNVQNSEESNNELLQNIWSSNLSAEYEFFDEYEYYDSLGDDEVEEAVTDVAESSEDDQKAKKGHLRFPRKRYPKVPIQLAFQQQASIDHRQTSQRLSIPGILNYSYSTLLDSKLIEKWLLFEQRDLIPKGFVMEYLSKYKNPNTRFVNAEIISSLGRLEIIEKILYRGLFAQKMQDFIGDSEGLGQLFKQVYSVIRFVQKDYPTTDYRTNPLAVMLVEFDYSHKYPDKSDSVYKILERKVAEGGINSLNDSERDYFNFVDQVLDKDKITQAIKFISYCFGVLDKGDIPNNKITRALYDGIWEVVDAKRNQMSAMQIALLDSENLSTSELLTLLVTFGLEAKDIVIINQHLAYKASYITHTKDSVKVIDPDASNNKFAHMERTSGPTQIHGSIGQYDGKILVIPNLIQPQSFGVKWQTKIHSLGTYFDDLERLRNHLKNEIPHNPTGHHLRQEEKGIFRIVSPRHAAGDIGKKTDSTSPTVTTGQSPTDIVAASIYAVNEHPDNANTVTPQENQHSTTRHNRQESDNFSGGQATSYDLTPEDLELTLEQLVENKTKIEKPRNRKRKVEKAPAKLPDPVNPNIALQNRLGQFEENVTNDLVERLEKLLNINKQYNMQENYKEATSEQLPNFEILENAKQKIIRLRNLLMAFEAQNIDPFNNSNQFAFYHQYFQMLASNIEQKTLDQVIDSDFEAVWQAAWTDLLIYLEENESKLPKEKFDWKKIDPQNNEIVQSLMLELKPGEIGVEDLDDLSKMVDFFTVMRNLIQKDDLSDHYNFFHTIELKVNNFGVNANLIFFNITNIIKSIALKGDQKSIKIIESLFSSELSERQKLEDDLELKNLLLGTSKLSISIISQYLKNLLKVDVIDSIIVLNEVEIKEVISILELSSKYRKDLLSKVNKLSLKNKATQSQITDNKIVEIAKADVIQNNTIKRLLNTASRYSSINLATFKYPKCYQNILTKLHHNDTLQVEKIELLLDKYKIDTPAEELIINILEQILEKRKALAEKPPVFEHSTDPEVLRLAGAVYPEFIKSMTN